MLGKKMRYGIMRMILCALCAALLLGFAGAACALDTWDGTAKTAFTVDADHDGTAAKPYLIESAAQLAWLAQEVNDGEDYRGEYFKLTDDIDLAEHQWLIIASDAAADGFGGIFDGADHKILNLKYTGNSAFAGLFGFLTGPSAAIKNVHLVNVQIASTHAGSTDSCAIGGIVGMSRATTAVAIEGCSVTGSITGGNTTAAGLYSLTGGIIGASEIGSVSACSFAGTVTGGNTMGAGSDSCTGGIAGMTMKAISSCSVAGSVKGGNSAEQHSFTGGIAGNTNDSVENCAVSGSVTGGNVTNNTTLGANNFDSATGGIAGVLEGNDAKIGNCAVSATVSGGRAEVHFGRSLTGGIVGLNVSENATSIANCYASSSVTGEQGGLGSYTGGIVGFAHNTGTKVAVSKCYSFGRISSVAYGPKHTGGVIGNLALGVIVDSYWNKDVNVATMRGIGTDFLGTREGNTHALTTAAFATGVNFASWAIPAVGTVAPASEWFYPTFDASRPRLKAFFDAAGTVVDSHLALFSPNPVIVKGGTGAKTTVFSVVGFDASLVSDISLGIAVGAEVSVSSIGNTITVTPNATTTVGAETVTVNYKLGGVPQDAVTFEVVILGSTSGGGGGGGGDGDGTPSASADVTLVKVAVGGTEYAGVVQPDGSILIAAPFGTDISNLTPNIAVSPGATYAPKGAHDFTKGPLEITVTAQDGTTKKYKINVVVQSQQPVAATFVNPTPSACSGTATAGAGGMFDVTIGIPFTAGFDPSTIQYISATITGLNNPSFFYTDASGNDVSIPARTANSLLKIKGTAADPSKVAITGLRIWKKGDAAEYYQNIPGGLKLSDIMGTTPSPSPSPSSGGGSGGCDAGAMGLAAVGLFCALRLSVPERSRRTGHDECNRRK